MLNLSTTRCAASLLLAFSFLISRSQPVTLPRIPSPAATVSQTIGISTVSVNYSRPSVKGRQYGVDLSRMDGINKRSVRVMTLPGGRAPMRGGDPVKGQPELGQLLL